MTLTPYQKFSSSIPSVAHLLQMPSYYSFEAMKSDNPALKVAGYATGAFILPIETCCWGVATSIDATLGLAEAGYRFARSKGGAKTLLIEKVVLASLQQFVAATITRWTLHYGTRYSWPLALAAGQLCAKSLISSFYPKATSHAFYKGGIQDPDDCEEPNISNRQARAQLDKRIPDGLYGEFKKRVLENKPLLEGFDVKQLKLALHPDKNLGRAKEAEILFKFLMEAST